MDRHGSYIDGKAARAQEFCQFMKKTLQLFVVLVAFFSFLCSYFSGFLFSYNLQFSTSIFWFSAHALDRKYMFLICNGILAFVAKNLNFSSSSLDSSRIMKNAEDGVVQITRLQAMLKEDAVQENVPYVGYNVVSTPYMAVAEEENMELQRETDTEDKDKGANKTKTEDFLLEGEEWEEEEEDDDDDEFKQNKAVEGASLVEEVNDARVSTEELNHKFEEFIRKMKEEIRIEAQQQLIAV